MKLKNNSYDTLKWVALIALPAVTVFISTVGEPLGWSFTNTALIVLPAVSVLLGALLQTSTAKFNQRDDEEYPSRKGE